MFIFKAGPRKVFRLKPVRCAKKVADPCFKQSRFYRSHKLFVTLSSVAIASKWDEPEKIKVFIVSTVGRKVLQSRKKEKCTIAQNQRSVVQYSVISERRNALCAITQEKHCYSQLGYLKSFNV